MSDGTTYDARVYRTEVYKGMHMALGEDRRSAVSEPACRWRVSRFSVAG